jgi:hypothetical protein
MVEYYVHFLGYIVGGACGTEGGKNMCMLLVGKPKGKRPLGRSRHRWIGNIKMDLSVIGLGGVAGLFWLKIGTG